jgi:hypothetical protein
MRRARRLICRIPVAVLIALLSFSQAQTQVQQPKIDSADLQLARQILRDAHAEVKKHYYDASYHGVDWDAQYHEFDEKMKRIATLGEGFSTISAFMMTFNDSNTFFMPPQTSVRVEYGFRL